MEIINNILTNKIQGYIICDDCMNVLKEIPDNCVDLILTDPPYNISKEITITRSRNKQKHNSSDISLYFGDWDVFESLEDYMQFTFTWIDECIRVLRPGGMFCTYFDKDKINFISLYLQKFHNFKTKGYYADCKSNPVPQARKVKWMSGWEIIGMWQKPGGKLTYNYQLGQTADYDIRPIVSPYSEQDGERIHPTQKPITVAKKFISYWSNENDLVLDPFCGSGFVCIEAERLGRKYIGIEKNRKFYEEAKKRIELAHHGLPLSTVNRQRGLF